MKDRWHTPDVLLRPWQLQHFLKYLELSAQILNQVMKDKADDGQEGFDYNISK